MARLKDSEIRAVVEKQMMPGEQFQQAGVAISIPGGNWMYLLGAIFVALFQRWFVVGLTDRRLLLLRYKGRLNVQEVREWDLDRVPPVKIKEGPINIRMDIQDPASPIVLKFHRAAISGNRPSAIAIGNALKRPANSAPRYESPYPAQDKDPLPSKPEQPLSPPGDFFERRPTVVENSSPQRGSTKVEDPYPQNQHALEEAPVNDPRGKTRFHDPRPAPGPGQVAPANGRKIVGFVVTYSWRPEGQLFPIREGRNLIGRDANQCDIALAEDDALSAVNTHITFRKNFVIGDMMSMGGTDLNGEAVEEQFRALNNYANIRTGKTRWTFVVINQLQGSGEVSGT
ncbi:MAG TPA: FHA domain-containing protein [Terriglobales bacterium]|jgi:hypothetical protein